MTKVVKFSDIPWLATSLLILERANALAKETAVFSTIFIDVVVGVLELELLKQACPNTSHFPADRTIEINVVAVAATRATLLAR